MTVAAPASTADARRITLDLLAARDPSASLCPSEVARALAAAEGGAWRLRMAEVHAAVDALAAEQVVRKTWRGEAVAAGPYRIRRAELD